MQSPNPPRRQRIFWAILRPLAWMIAGAALEFLVFGILVVRQDDAMGKNDRLCREGLTATYAMVSDAVMKRYMTNDAYPKIEVKLNAMQDACANHDAKGAEAIGIDVAMTLAFLSDNAQVKSAPAAPQ